MPTKNFDQGALVRVYGVFTNSAGTAIDPTTVKIAYRADAIGTTTIWTYGTDAEVIRSATGTYYADIDSNESPGRYEWNIYSVGTGQAADNGDFYIRRVLTTPAPPSDPMTTINSTNATFLQAGTGAVTRSVRDRMRDWISVKDFGAVGDNSTDDTAAITAAITYANSLAAESGRVGYTVFFPAGSYRVSSQIVNREGVILKGFSRNSSVIKASASFPTATAVVLLGHSSESETFGCRLEDIDIDANGITDSMSVESTKINEMSGLRRVSLTNWKSKGLYIHGSAAQNYTLDDLYVLSHSSPNGAGIGIDIDGGGSFFRSLSNFTVISGGTDFATGVRVENIIAGHISNANIESVTDGILVGSSAGVTGLRVTNVQGYGITNTVRIANIAGQAQSTVFSNIVAAGGTTNSLKDDLNSNTYTDSVLSTYILGHGTPRTSFKIGDGLFVSGNGLRIGSSAAPTAKLDIITDTSTPYLQSRISSNAALVWRSVGRAVTVNTTATAAWTLTLSDTNAYFVTARVAMRDTSAGGGDGALLHGVFYREGGGAIMLSSATTIAGSTHTIIFSTSGNDVRVLVTGTGTNTIAWQVDTDVIQVNS